MVQCCTSTGKPCKISAWNCENFTSQHILVLLHDEDFVLRTITEGSVNLDKFPTSRVCQLAKKFESSKATAQHIKQVAGDLQATQINLMRHQRTELPTNRHKKARPACKPKQYKAPENWASNQVKKSYDNKKPHRASDCCNKCGDSIHMQGFQCPVKKYQCKCATNMVTSPVYATKRKSGASQEQLQKS